nr:hypothetical protein [Tanacetum cinerariifolium]
SFFSTALFDSSNQQRQLLPGSTNIFTGSNKRLVFFFKLHGSINSKDHRGRQIIPKDYFINKDMEYLKGRDSSRRYSTSVTKTKAATYKLKWIKDLVPKLWSPVVVKYDKHAYFGTSNWGPKCQTFYGFTSNLTSSKDVYSRRRIIAVTRLTIIKKYDYDHLEEIKVRRDDQQLNTFKEADFKRLHLQDNEDMLLLLVQQKPTNLTID